MMVCIRSGRILYGKLGGTAQVKAFVPAIAGARAFLMYKSIMKEGRRYD